MTGNLTRQIFLVLVILKPSESQVFAEFASEGLGQQAGLLAAGLVLGQAIDRYVPQELSDALRRSDEFVDQVIEIYAGEEGMRLDLVTSLRAQSLLRVELEQPSQK